MIGRIVSELVAWWHTETMSTDWLRAQGRREERVKWHGVEWRWPINKRLNEDGLVNRERLRTRA